LSTKLDRIPSSKDVAFHILEYVQQPPKFTTFDPDRISLNSLDVLFKKNIISLETNLLSDGLSTSGAKTTPDVEVPSLRRRQEIRKDRNWTES